MSALHLAVLAYTLGVLPTMIYLLRELNKEIERGTVTDLYTVMPRRNIMLMLFVFGLLWPALLAGTVFAKLLKPLWKDGPPDDPDDPEEQTT